MPSLRLMLGAAVAALIAAPLLVSRLRQRRRQGAVASNRLGDPGFDLAKALKNVVDNVSAPWPTFADPVEAAVFLTINSELEKASPNFVLWGSLGTIASDRIEAIRNEYEANHTLSPAEAKAWSSVMGQIEGVFASQEELFNFLQNTETVLHEMVTWLGETISEASELAALDQTTIIQVGDQNRSIWQIILAPLKLIPQVGSTVSTIVDGVVRLSTSDGSLTPNPVLQAIEGTTADLQIAAKQALAVVVTNIGQLRTAACADYGKLKGLHDLLVKAETCNSRVWSRDQFSESSLNAVEIEIWKPIMAVGWRVQVPASFSDAGNTRVNVNDYPAFLSLNAALGDNPFFYDQVTGPFHEDFSPDYYSARCRIVGLDNGTPLSEKAANRLFVSLSVPRDDIFNGKNGWSLGVTGNNVWFKDYPYCYRAIG